MKRVLTALVIIALCAAGGFACWKYFSTSYKEYEVFAEIEKGKNDKLYFLDEMVVKTSDSEVAIYKVTEDYFGELFTKNCENPEIIFTSPDFFILKDGNDYNVYYEKDGLLTSTLLPNQIIYSIHQYADSLCVKMIDGKGKTTIYRISKLGLIKNISVDFDFVDYCIDPVTGEEYFISFELNDEFEKLKIRSISADSGDGKKQEKYCEIDNFVYNDIDCIGNTIIFYTDFSIVTLNTKDFVRRTQYFYDIDSLEKFIFDDKIIYYSDKAYFNGVDNLLVVTSDKNEGKTIKNTNSLTKYKNQLIFLENDCVKVFTGSESIIDDSILFKVEDAKAVNTMNDIVAVTKNDRVQFMKVVD